MTEKKAKTDTEESTDEDNLSAHTLKEEISQYVQRETQTESEDTLDVYPGISYIDYNFVGERQNPQATNLIESTAHLIKGCLGAGMLGIHEAFMLGGIWTSLAVALVIGVLVPYTMLMLVRSAQTMYHKIHVPRLSYPDLAEAAVATGPYKKLRRYSKVIRYTVDMCLFMEMCGSCCIYEIMIARTLKQALEAASTEIEELNLSLRIYVLLTSLPLLALCMIRSLKCLGPCSLVADLFIAICVSIAIFYSLSSVQNIRERPGWKGAPGLFRLIGTCIYSVQGVPIALPIENNMRSPHHFATVLQFGMFAVVFLVASVGFFGYWGIGEKCQTPITMHLPAATATNVFQFFVALMLGIAFAVNFLVPFRIAWHYIGKRHKRKRSTFERLYRAIQVIVISCVATACPRINFMMTYLGAVFCVIIGFIFPAFIESLVTWRDDRRRRVKWRLLKNILLMIFGAVVCCGAMYSFQTNTF